MAEVIRFRKEFLPHVVRLFSPNLPRVDARINYFQQLFAMGQPGPEQTCLLVKGKDRLLACANLVSLDKVQRDLIYVKLAVDRDLAVGMWEDFWGQCLDLAKTLVSGTPVLRIEAREDLPAYLQESGFKTVREQVELHARLGNLPAVQAATDDFEVVSLADRPDLEGAWLDVFNNGLSVFWDIPPLSAGSFQRLRSLPGYDASAFRLGLGGGEAVTALFYSILDSEQKTVRINAAATSTGKRSKGYGRRMVKEALTHLEQAGMQEATIYTDCANQATNLLFKMLGFTAKGKLRIMESSARDGAATRVINPVDEVAAAADNADEERVATGFFPGFHSTLNSKKDK